MTAVRANAANPDDAYTPRTHRTRQIVPGLPNPMLALIAGAMVGGGGVGAFAPSPTDVAVLTQIQSDLSEIRRDLAEARERLGRIEGKLSP